MSQKTITTERLTLVAETVEMARADLKDHSQLAELLNVRIIDHWPPPLNDTDSQTWFLNYLEENPNAIGWTGWYFLLHDPSQPKKKLIGSGGFRGKPNAEGSVEIGYSLIEEFQGHGYATEAVKSSHRLGFPTGRSHCHHRRNLPGTHTFHPRP